MDGCIYCMYYYVVSMSVFFPFSGIPCIFLHHHHPVNAYSIL